jgi:signal transduction histidine kinase
MKTALLLTNSAGTQRLLTEVLGEKTNLVLLPAPVDPTREKFDALFTTWLRLVDAVILDAAALGETTRWAVESLSGAQLQERQAVVVRATATQRTLYPMPANWLIVSDTDTTEQLRQSLGTFFELRDAQAKLKRADAVIARQRVAVPARPAAAPQVHTAPGSAASFDSYRYRDALKNISRVLGERHDERTLVTEFARLVRELLGAGKLAVFQRSEESDQFVATANAGLPPEVTGHLRLTLDAGIGHYLTSTATIVRRIRQSDPYALDYDPEVAREFELLGTETAVPMFDGDRLLGVLTFSARLTGEPVTNEELELVYHLMTQLAQALRNVRLQEQVAAQQRLLSEVLANVQSGVLVVAKGGRILSLNHRARTLLEVETKDSAGQELSAVPSRVADVVFESLETGQEIRQREVVLPRSNRPLSVSVTRFAANGELVAVALIEDLTQVKLQQAQARELADKEFFTRLSARMSHEMKNALVSIKIFAQLLPQRYTEKEFREQFSTTVANEVNRVDVLVNNLTFFGQPLVLVCEELVLSDVIDACLNNVSREFARKQVAYLLNVGEKAPDALNVPVITVKKNFSHKLARLEADKIRLMQAFEHVLRNTVQAMPSGGRVAISTSDATPADFADGQLPAGGAVRIEWQDTGEGISLENLPRVTEPFITTRNVGVGLGLTIVKKILERHGGRLEIDSLLGRGTTVKMILPVQTQPHPDDALVAAAAKNAGSPPVSTGEEHDEEGDRLLQAREKQRRRRS